MLASITSATLHGIDGQLHRLTGIAAPRDGAQDQEDAALQGGMLFPTLDLEVAGAAAEIGRAHV